MRIRTVNFFEGFHFWENAPANLLFLKNNHRHIFHIICYFEVVHDDREIEIFEKQWEIEKYIKEKYGTPCIFGRMSCEHIAREILAFFSPFSVEVLEDGMGGAFLLKQ